MRTDTDIDQELMEQAMELLGAKTKRATVEAALKQIVREVELRRALDNLRGIDWQGDFDAMR